MVRHHNGVDVIIVDKLQLIAQAGIGARLCVNALETW